MPRAIEETDPVDKFVGERLRAERLQAGMSQTELGKAMDLSFQQVQKYERGINRMSASKLVLAAQTFNVPVADFFPSPVPDGESPRRIDIAAFRGGAALAEYFAAMTAAQRLTLVQVAREFAQAAAGAGSKG